MSQAAKNMRQAFPSIPYGSRAWEVTQAAALWSETEDPETDTFLQRLDLYGIAQRCLVDGDTLEAAGEAGPYGSAAQRRAWAAGRLAAACEAIHLAKSLQSERQADVARIARLERDLAYARAETRAAARFKDIVVPFREPRKTRSVDWDAV